MPEVNRKAEAEWNGPVRGGAGSISSASGALDKSVFSLGTRAENEKGTNPEELIAAAHAGCFSMAFAATLGRKGHEPERIHTHATCTLSIQPGGFKITKLQLETTANVPGIDEATLQEIAREAEAACPISNLFRGNAEIELNVKLG